MVAALLSILTYKYFHMNSSGVTKYANTALAEVDGDNQEAILW